MALIRIPAKSDGNMEGVDRWIDPTTPPTNPVKTYRIKGTNFIVNQLPLRANLDDFELLSPQ